MQAANIILETFPEFEMHIVGSGTDSDIIELKRILNKGLSERVKFLGTKNQTQIAYMMNESRLLLFPSLSEALPKFSWKAKELLAFQLLVPTLVIVPTL